MNHIQKMAALAALSTFASFSSAAQAQLAIQNGAFVSVSGSQTTGAGITTMDLGNASASTALTLVNNMPMSLTYGSVTANISFTGTSGVYDGGGYATTSSNYLIAASGGSVTLDFSQTQKYFSAKWGSQSYNDQFSFYNGGQLVASTTATVIAPVSLATTGGTTSYVDFNFTELGYDRVVVSSGPGNVEFSAISFSENIQAAPIPLNAASLGGLMSFLMMLAMRGKGGTQVAIRMAFASLMPRRRGLA